MAILPFTDSQCFFFAILAFAVVGFYRGWKKEILSLLFILIAAFLVRPSSGGGFTEMIARLPATISYLVSGTVSPSSAPAPTTAFLGAWGPILAFLLIAALGYYLGEKAFPKPASPTERILGILPAIAAAALRMLERALMLRDSRDGYGCTRRAAGEFLATTPITDGKGVLEE